MIESSPFVRQVPRLSAWLDTAHGSPTLHRSMIDSTTSEALSAAKATCATLHTPTPIHSSPASIYSPPLSMATTPASSQTASPSHLGTGDTIRHGVCNNSSIINCNSDCLASANSDRLLYTGIESISKSSHDQQSLTMTISSLQRSHLSSFPPSPAEPQYLTLNLVEATTSGSAIKVTPPTSLATGHVVQDGDNLPVATTSQSQCRLLSHSHSLSLHAQTHTHTHSLSSAEELLSSAGVQGKEKKERKKERGGERKRETRKRS